MAVLILNAMKCNNEKKQPKMCYIVVVVGECIKGDEIKP